VRGTHGQVDPFVEGPLGLLVHDFGAGTQSDRRRRIRGRLGGSIVRIRVIMNLLETPDKDLPLRDDIRLLGRILGDTVRSQEGEPVFAIVEHIRQTSIRFHREEDEAARHELEATLNSLSHGQNIQIIRAFSYFSQLANIAEDQHHIRRTRAHALAASGEAQEHDRS